MWITQAAAVQGAGHKRLGLPGQDRAWVCREGEVTAAALADGAGSAPLSHEGAEVVTKCVSQLLCRDFEELYRCNTPAELKQAVLAAARAALYRRAEELGADPKDLACTLLAVAVEGDRYLIFHLGDGLIACQTEGRLKAASVPWNGEYSNSTVFVTSPDALAKCRVQRGMQPALDGFGLMSDGSAATLYSKAGQRVAPLMKRLFQRAVLMEPEVSAKALEAVLSQVIAARTRDDCSLVLLVRPQAAGGQWELLPRREQAAILGVTTQHRSRRRRQINRYAALYGVTRRQDVTATA